MARDEDDEDIDPEPSKKKYVIWLFIFSGGSVLVGLGVALTYAGLFIPHPGGDQTPGLITGPTCVALGAVAIFLSVDDYRRQRKIWNSLGPLADSVGVRPVDSVPICCRARGSTSCTTIKVAPHVATGGVRYSSYPEQSVVLDVSRLGREH